MSRPTVTVKCVADQHHAGEERIIEFSDPETGFGGLIAFQRRTPRKGKPYLQVCVYRQDRPGVRVFVDRGRR